MGYKAVQAIVPLTENENGVLFDFPSGKIEAQPFLPGSRQALEEVAEAVRKKYGKDFPGAVIAWEEFLDKAPQTDDVEEYLKNNALYIPFKKELFGITSDADNFANER